MSFSFNCFKCAYPVEVEDENQPGGHFRCPRCHQHYSLPISEESVREQATQSIANAKLKQADEKPKTGTQMKIQTKFKIKAPPRINIKK